MTQESENRSLDEQFLQDPVLRACPRATDVSIHTSSASTDLDYSSDGFRPLKFRLEVHPQRPQSEASQRTLRALREEMLGT